MYLLSDEDDAPKGPAKKNKRRWCGGHEGREHVPVVTKSKYSGGWQCGYREFSWRTRGPRREGVSYACWHEITCEKCHRVLEYKSKVCPDYTEALARYQKEKT